MSRTTNEGPSGNRPDDGQCVVCGADADGVDARTRQPMCRRCASVRCDGGDQRAGRRRVTSSVKFGGARTNQVSTPGDDVNHLSGEVVIEVSGASTDYPHPTRLQREIEAAVLDVIENYGEKVSDDVDRGDGPVTDGGRSMSSNLSECRYCGELFTTPYYRNLHEAEDCSARGDGIETDGGEDQFSVRVGVQEKHPTVTDGGVVEGAKYHAVCSDCTFEAVEDDRHRAAQAVDEHEKDEPTHEPRFEEVRGR